MATVSAVAGNAKPIIPLIPEIAEADRKHIDLKRQVAPDDKRVARVLLIDNIDKETILRGILEFIDAAQASRLSLTTGPNLFNKFREILEGQVRDDWDVARAGMNATVANFQAALVALIELYFEQTDLADQKRYTVIRSDRGRSTFEHERWSSTP